MQPEVRGTSVVDNFVACEEQIIMLKTGSKSVQNGGDITD